MRLAWSVRDDVEWTLTIRLDPDESTNGTGQGGRDVTLITDQCRVLLPGGTVAPHPDARALSAVTITSPWLHRRVVFDSPISERLAAVLSEYFGLEAGPVDNTLSPFTGSRVGLAYSGGADSIAVSSFLPIDTPLIHLERRSHPRVPNRAMHFRADVQSALVGMAADQGRQVSVVSSDLEFIVGPLPTFPEWTAVAVPLIMMSNHLDLGGAAFGTILGSRYLSNGYRYLRPPVSEKWAALFEAAGLPFVRPACGLTEVSTIRIAQSSDLASIMRSCALGTLDAPCLNCQKCLRKELTMAGIERRPLDPVLLGNLTETHPAVVELLEPPPYYFQHVLEFGLARAEAIGDTFLAATRDALGPTVDSTDWATRYYRPAVENDIPDRFRPDIVERIQSSVGYMTAVDNATVEGWDASARAHSGSGE